MTERETVLVTGGTSGIGLATAEVLVERGARVVVTGRDPDRLAAAETTLGPRAYAVRADARSLADCARVAARVRERSGHLTGLFLNAGGAMSAPVEAVTEAAYDDQFALNAKGAYFTLQQALPLLTEGASVVMTIGVVVANGQSGATVSTASHGALLGMMPSLALELAPRRIRVNAVSPGAIDTPLWSSRAASPEAHAETVAAVSTGIPFGRFGTAREVGEVVAFLLSDAAGYVTGQHLAVAGGL